MQLSSRRCLRSQNAALETTGIRSPAGLRRAEASLLQVQPPLCLVIRRFCRTVSVFCVGLHETASVWKGSGLARHERNVGCLPGGGRVFVCRRRRNFYLSVAKGLVVLESVTAASATRRCRKQLFIDAESRYFLHQREI